MAGEMPCILYEGTKNAAGYGVLPWEVHGSRLAHRAALANKLGRKVSGLVMHSCDNPPCINPEHLSEGTHADNAADAKAKGRTRGGRSDQTHCSKGHALTAENVILKPNARCKSGFERVCRACRAESNRKLAARRKAARHERGLIRKREV